MSAAAQGTIRERERSIDAYRAFAILTVIAGHWLAFVLLDDAGRLDGRNLLEIWPPAPWLTWFFQVMPLFFVVGGYANAASWTGLRREVSRLGWVGARVWRLVVPSLVLLTVVTTVSMASRWAGADAATVDLALTIVGLPLWFLAVYLVVSATTPWLVEAEQRWGLRVPAGLLATCVAVDLLANLGGVPIGLLTYPLFWLGVYAAGVAWRSGRLLEVPWLAPALVVGGAAALVLLVVVGPYPVSMLAALGEEIQNNGPPSSALLALAMAQLGIVLLLRHRVRRWCEHRRVWAGVVAVNLVAMSLYLWHMVAALLASLVFWFTGLVSAAAALSTTWWWQRPLWYLVCAGMLLVIVRAVRRFEWVTPVVEPVPQTPRRLIGLGAGVTLLAAGMVALTVTGLTAGPAGISVLGLLAFVAGAVTVRAATGIVATTSTRRTRAPSDLS
ncbi:MAG: acyltransferase [Jiangellales bacterium]